MNSLRGSQGSLPRGGGADPDPKAGSESTAQKEPQRHLRTRQYV